MKTAIFYISLVSALILGNSVSAAGQLADNLAVTGDPALKAVLEGVRENLSNLSSLKEAALSQEEREKKEADFRKKALAGIAALSLFEISDLNSKLDSLKNLSAAAESERDRFKKELKDLSDYLEEFKGKLAGDLSLTEVKESAAAFKKWREETYNQAVGRITDFVFIYSEKPILILAGERFKKIAADLARLKTASASDFIELDRLLDKADRLLKEAGGLNLKAEEIFWRESATSTVSAGFSPPAGSGETEPAPAAPVEPEIKDLIKESLGKVKFAYRIFVNMGEIAKKKLSN